MTERKTELIKLLWHMKLLFLTKMIFIYSYQKQKANLKSIIYISVSYLKFIKNFRFMSKISKDVIELSQRIAENRVKELIKDTKNLMELAKKGIVEITRADSSQIKQLTMNIENMGQQIKAKFKGGQIFLPIDENCQCLVADGDQEYVLKKGQNSIQLCGQENKKNPNGCSYQLTDKILKSYIQGISQKKLWQIKNSSDAIESLSKISETFQKVLKAFSQPIITFDNDDDDSVPKQCVICLDKRSQYLYTGCGHCILCQDCKDQNIVKGKCLICRQTGKIIKFH